jgi:hypothetical protein
MWADGWNVGANNNHWARRHACNSATHALANISAALFQGGEAIGPGGLASDCFVWTKGKPTFPTAIIPQMPQYIG